MIPDNKRNEWPLERIAMLKLPFMSLRKNEAGQVFATIAKEIIELKKQIGAADDG